MGNLLLRIKAFGMRKNLKNEPISPTNLLAAIKIYVK